MTNTASERVRLVRENYLGLSRIAAAKRLSEVSGSEINYKRLSGKNGWEKKEPDVYALALVAQLHPDPGGCFEYLVGKRTEPPRIDVYSTERAEQALRAICEMLKASGACLSQDLTSSPEEIAEDVIELPDDASDEEDDSVAWVRPRRPSGRS